MILNTSPRSKHSYYPHVADEGGTERSCQFPDSPSKQAADPGFPPRRPHSRLALTPLETGAVRWGSSAETVSYAWRRRFAVARGVTPLEGSKARPATLEVGTGTQRGVGVQKAVASLRKKPDRAVRFLPFAGPATLGARAPPPEPRAWASPWGILGNPIQRPST